MKLFNLPIKYFVIFSAIILVAAYAGVLPEGMTGCFAFMIVVGTILYDVGERTPIVRSYLGGGAIVVIFGTAVLNYFHLLPAAIGETADGAKEYAMGIGLDLVGNIGNFFKPTGAFLDFYIAALITGSILGMNRKLLAKAAARYFPAVFGGILFSFVATTIVGAIMGFGALKSLLLIALPIMGGGMGAGAVPLSKIFETTGTMTAADAISIMTPAVAIGNAISIVLAGVLSKSLKKDKWNGRGNLMLSTVTDPKELEISPEMQKKRDHIEV